MRSKEVLSNVKKEEREKLQSIKRAEAAERKATAEAGRDIERSLAKQEAARKRFAKGIGSGVGKAAGNALGSVWSLGGTALALTGGYGAAQGIKSAVQNQSTATDIELMQRGRGSAFSNDEIRKNAANAGNHLGFSTADVLDAQKSFLSVHGTTSDNAQQSSRMWAETARAAGNGTTVSDVAKMDASLSKFGITKPEDRKAALANTLAMSRSTGVSFAEVANGSDSQLERAKGLGLNGLTGLKQIQQLDALAHISHPEDAEGASENFLKTITANRKEMEKRNIHAFDKNNNLMDPNLVMGNDVIANKGRQDLIQKDLGARGGSSLANEYVSTYNNTKANTKGSEAEKEKAAAEAVAKMMNELANKTSDYSQVQSDAAKHMEDASAKWDSAIEQLKGSVEEKLLPLLPPLIEKFKALIPEMTSLVGHVTDWVAWAETNPWSAIMEILGAFLAKELAVMALAAGGKAVATGIVTTALPAIGAGITSAAGATVAGITAGTAALALAAAAAVGAAGYETYDLYKKTAGFKSDAQLNKEAKVEREKADSAAAAQALLSNTEALKANTQSNQDLMSSDQNSSSLPPRTPNPITPR